ncbi:MAG: Stk1 family PASTA domain-containing Ser/Thr kinase [Lachnospiraceae bacterium]|nr:Stk1 family PASTA domain-containing Ser/Thr kinase [Lachnospiraceae bacterium]
MLKAGMMLVNRYEILGRIGSGGMADVYKATDHKLNRFVAVKVMKPEFAQDGSFVKKFTREAQAAAGLANPNIVNVYDVGEDQGNYFIVMELVEGITLKEYIAKKGKLSVREATSIAIQVCMGLAAAHDQGIVHRDVKPQNIIISTDGKVKVTDFGIARAASSNTISANAMGSVHYSSPEQVRGGYSDARSDIYSLGITLYEMVTGRVPFDGETTVAIAIKQLQDEMVPPSKYTPDLPYALEQIIFKCTQKSVDRRYQSMAEVINDLKRSLIEPEGHFVQLTPLSDHARTVMISPEERDAIRKADNENRRKAEEAQKTYSSIDAARKGYEEPEEEDEDEEDDDEGEVSTGLEKAVTIGSFIVCGLIVCVLIYFIGRAAGLFHFGTGSTSSDSTVVSTGSAVAGDDSNTTGSTTSQETVSVPKIVGMDEATAQQTAQQYGLGIKYDGEKASDEAEGTIIEQDPKAGSKVARNSTIHYYRSSGKAQISIPSGIVGSTLQDAENALKNAGFTNVTTSQEQSDSVEIGNIISVSPTEGSKAAPTDQITLVVSTGSETSSEVTVRDYVGMDYDSAAASAQSAGLTVKEEYGSTDSVNTGEVMSQSLSSGSKVAVGTEITLTVNDPDKASQGTTGGTGDSETWTTSARLGQPENYGGGAYRITLKQTVDGQETETTLDEGTSITFPYLLQATGATGVTDGTIYLYEMNSEGNYEARATWPVTFSAKG